MLRMTSLVGGTATPDATGPLTCFVCWRCLSSASVWSEPIWLGSMWSGVADRDRVLGVDKLGAESGRITSTEPHIGQSTSFKPS